SDSFVYKSGSKNLVSSLREDIGGGSINTSVAFSRLGFNVGCICKVGDDGDGKTILELLKKENVKFLGIVSKGVKSGHSVILDYPGRDRAILKYNGPCSDIYYRTLPKFKTRWLYFSSLAGNACGAQETLARKMTKLGVKLAFNPSEYLIKRIDISKVLKMTDVLVLNKEEAIAIVRKYKRRGDLIESLLSLGPKIVVITDGPRVVHATDGIKRYSIKPQKNIKIVERTGSGDAFASGFISGLMANKTIDDSLKLGMKISKSVLSNFGARNKIPRMHVK
ncbi:MAG: carbohydrate kinase family protein, partial [Nanoarchaeota archaeon]|nr:carbohydrate kinase family protein [Nanoarchaeota archaeon]